MPIRIVEDLQPTINDGVLAALVVSVALIIIFHKPLKNLIMRIFLTCLFLVSLSFTSFSQTFTVKSGKAALTSVEIAGKDFQGGMSRTGSTYIMRTSQKTGKDYKSYLGHKSSKTVTVENQTFPVWSNKPYDKWEVETDVKFYYYVISEKTNYPKKVYLTRN